MRQAEPPSSSRSSLFLIGKNSRGNWVVQDPRGLRGGLFVDRAEALRFAMFENGNRPQAVIMVAGVFELDLGHTHLALQKDAPLHRAVQRSGVIVAIPILAGLHHQYARI
jgi:hypothetical protein